VIDELAAWVSRLADVLRGEFCFCLAAWSCRSFWYVDFDCSCCFAKCWLDDPGTKRQPFSRRCRDWMTPRCRLITHFGQMGRGLGPLRCCVFALNGCRWRWSTAGECWVAFIFQFYPLAAVPSKLEALCRFFVQPSELRRVMDHQIRAGARAALGLVHSHWPGVNLDEVVRGPPGGGGQSMDSHYAAIDDQAGRVVACVFEESDRSLGAHIMAKKEPRD